MIYMCYLFDKFYREYMNKIKMKDRASHAIAED